MQLISSLALVSADIPSDTHPDALPHPSSGSMYSIDGKSGLVPKVKRKSTAAAS